MLSEQSYKSYITVLHSFLIIAGWKRSEEVIARPCGVYWKLFERKICWSGLIWETLQLVILQKKWQKECTESSVRVSKSFAGNTLKERLTWSRCLGVSGTISDGKLLSIMWTTKNRKWTYHVNRTNLWPFSCTIKYIWNGTSPIMSKL